MFIKSFITIAALAGTISALPVKRGPTSVATSASPKATPAGYASGYLEDYQVYHTRYLALGCQDHRNATSKDEYFEDCCHPLLATENITIARPEYCIPSNATLSAVESTYVANATDSVAESEYCDEATSVVDAVSSIEATATESLSVVTLTETNSASSTAAYTLAVQKAIVSTSAAAPVTTSSVEYVTPSSSSEYVAPTTSTSEYVAPTSSTPVYVAPTTSETPVYVAPTSTYEAPAVTSAAASSGSSWIGNAYATFFYQNGAAGACGVYNSDSAHIVAIPWSYYGDSGAASSNCGRWITIRRTDTGATTTAQVADLCPSCSTSTSIDLSYGAFTAIASTGEGMVPVEWQFSS